MLDWSLFLVAFNVSDVLTYRGIAQNYEFYRSKSFVLTASYFIWKLHQMIKSCQILVAVVALWLGGCAVTPEPVAGEAVADTTTTKRVCEKRSVGTGSRTGVRVCRNIEIESDEKKSEG
ncbi:MAG: hypothetical protein RQ741_07245 [Wenzhouxiangellaceae bacterium]|nr:hypothetical protein [Wenzhouxiangellaceae bacterium]